MRQWPNRIKAFMSLVNKIKYVFWMSYDYSCSLVTFFTRKSLYANKTIQVEHWTSDGKKKKKKRKKTTFQLVINQVRSWIISARMACGTMHTYMDSELNLIKLGFFSVSVSLNISVLLSDSLLWIGAIW